VEKTEVGAGKFVSRHISQLKILARLFEHELDSGKGGKEVALDRDLAESMLDTIEIFIEDCEDERTIGGTRERVRQTGEPKTTVSRLN